MNHLEEVSYWMVTGQWVEINRSGMIATTDNPNPHNRPVVVVRTEFINMHPLRFLLLALQSRLNYAIIDHIQINRETYEALQLVIAASTNGSGQNSVEIGDQ
jgi:hypothetical protein